jgi:membrane protease YdiL (CAAX protease family)
MLAASGMFSGFIGEALYYLAFLIPILMGFYSSLGLKKGREQMRGLAEPADSFHTIDRARLVKLLPLVAPAVFAVFLTSMLSSLLLSLFGVTSAPVEDVGIVRMLLIHALVPAVLEEALFRYIPMKLLLPYSRRWCVIYSALVFALIHCSFVQMPYAFVAGIIFMTVDVALGSALPSVILHFVNNAASVVLMKYCSTPVATAVFISVMLLLTLVSLVFVYRRRGEYLSDIRAAFDKGEGFAATYSPLALVVVCFCLAASTI